MNTHNPVNVKQISIDAAVGCGHSDLVLSRSQVVIQGLCPSYGCLLYTSIPVENIKDVEGIYTGELADGVDWFIDYRNMKNDSGRYFFLNTFS